MMSRRRGEILEPQDRLARARTVTPAVLDLLERLAGIESPTGDEEGSRRVAALLETELRERGARVQSVAAAGLGVHLCVDLGSPGEGGQREPPLLVVGHLDTVHPVGTLERLPVREDDGRMYGPGVYDMKGSWAALVGALDLILDEGAEFGPVRLLITCDEEEGAPDSRALLEAEAAGARAGLVLEPPLPGGALKVARKGMAEYRVRVRGRPAHAGIEPEKGASAVHEMARLILRFLALGDPRLGTTVNVGTVEGGTVGNVVAEDAEAEVDVRFWTVEEGRRLDRWFRAVEVEDPECTVEVTGGVNRWAMEPTESSGALVERVVREAELLGRSLATGRTGGVSDGQILAAAGCPVLDGLGIEGAGAHTLQEHILLEDLPFRVALYSRLLRVL